MKFHIYCNIMRIYLSARPSVQSRAGRHLKWPGNSRSALPSLLRQFAPDSTPFQRLLDPFELGSDWVTLFCKSLSSGQARKGSWFLVSNIPRLAANRRIPSFFSPLVDCRNISPPGGGGGGALVTTNERTNGRSSLSSSSRNKIGALPDWNNQFDFEWSWRALHVLIRLICFWWPVSPVEELKTEYGFEKIARQQWRRIEN